MADLARPTTPPPPPPPPEIAAAAATTNDSSCRRKRKPSRAFRVLRHVLRAFPIIPPTCKLPDPRIIIPGERVTGTLFGHRRGRVSLLVQENPHAAPTAVVELPMLTHALQREMGHLGMVRIALECDKRPSPTRTPSLMEEPAWTMYCNGKKVGYSIRREVKAEDLRVMELLKGVTMGAGVLPGLGPEPEPETEPEPDGELAYIRADFDRVVGSRDSETLYMVTPDGSMGPELTIFFIRL